MLKCATNLFGEKGYHQTSIEDICKAVGIKKATFYHYANCKEDLLYEIHDKHITALIISTHEAISAKVGCSAQEKLKAVINVYVKAINEYLPEISTFVKEMNYLSKDKFNEISRKRKIMYNLLNNVIAEGIQNEEFTNISPDIVTLFISGMANWMHMWYLPSGRMSIDQIANLATDLIVNGLRLRIEVE